MIHIELHHRHDGFEFGDKGGEHAELIHPPQSAFGVSVFQQQIKEDTPGFLVVAHILVDQVQIGCNQAHGIRVYQHTRAQRFFEDFQ